MSKKKRTKAPFLGTTTYFFCSNCYSPLLDSKCCLCNQYGVEFFTSPPGDLYIAFEAYYNFIESAVMKTIKVKLPRDFVYLLNKIPVSNKTADEVYFLNKRLGVLFFDSLSKEFTFKFDEFGLKFFLSLLFLESSYDFDEIKKNIKYVSVDDCARDKISRGANILAPGIIEKTDFNEGDYVIVLHEDRIIALGKAKINASEIKRRGIVLKNVFSATITISDLKEMAKNIERIREVIKGLSRGITLPSKSILSLEEYNPWKYIPPEAADHLKVIIAANRCTLERLAKDAISFIRRYLKKGAIVSFSGGKDSSCTLDLVIQARIPFIVIFADTGLEFPETTAYVAKILEKIGGTFQLQSKVNTIEIYKNEKAIVVRRNEKVFWTLAKHLGFPAMDFRWCCKVCKFIPIRTALSKINVVNNKMIVGTRRYESFLRKRQKRIEFNRWTRTHNYHPIQEWPALAVWLYVFLRKIPTNPLYKLGFHRLGCWLCPSSEYLEISLLEELHPELWKKLEGFFITILPNKTRDEVEEIIRSGIWRKTSESANIIPRKLKKIKYS